MQRQKVRVIVASEHRQVRDFLIRLIEQEDKAVIVGQAANASGALTLVRNLRPDITIMDCYLPHAVGLDAMPLTRIGGLDAAQIISEETPDTRVILLNNLAAGMLPARNLSSGAATIYAIKSNGNNISFESPDSPYEVLAPKFPIFASVVAEERSALPWRSIKISDKVIFFGALGIVGGGLLVITYMLAPVGIALGLLGAGTVLLGLAGKLTASWWQRITAGWKVFNGKVR